TSQGWSRSGSATFQKCSGCTFEEDVDLNQCEYSQREDDDFEWELIRSYVMPHLTSDLPHGELSPPLPQISHQHLPV
uniref:MAM domain-containing protein n=1 Tax=Gopherus agassizii TaxID=38772 RepID=A0A452HNI2_9SAUR